ncbi:MAG: hypothetical protein H6739_01620 [Alphaproteobacteria bacterium]|nr:hypothetical protein [Alphaproteobacteria bacterium]
MPLVALLTLACAGRGPSPDQLVGVDIVEESVPQALTLTGSAAVAASEISGMTWWGNNLALLPQYGAGGDPEAPCVYLIEADAIAAAIADGTPLQPRELPIDASSLSIDGFEGYEAIVFDGARAWVSVEASPDAGMRAWLVPATLSGDTLVLEGDAAVEVVGQAGLPNKSEETLLLLDDRICSIYEANGETVNPSPVAHCFDRYLAPVEQPTMTPVSYRVTDATAPDEEGRFWVSNFNFKGSDLDEPAVDVEAHIHGFGESHTRSANVERLLELQATVGGFVRTETPPIWLQLREDDEGRNWEGIARWRDGGLLIVTDKFPETILAWVPPR